MMSRPSLLSWLLPWELQFSSSSLLSCCHVAHTCKTVLNKQVVTNLLSGASAVIGPMSHFQALLTSVICSTGHNLNKKIQLITLFRISYHHLLPVILVQRRESSHPPLNTRSRSNACHSTDLFSSPVSETLHFSHTADKQHCSSDNVFKTSCLCLNLNRQQTPSADHTVQSDEVGR